MEGSLIVVRCPSCGNEVEVSDSHVGEPCTCDRCRCAYVIGGVYLNESSHDLERDAWLAECPACGALNELPPDCFERNTRCYECGRKFRAVQSKQVLPEQVLQPQLHDEEAAIENVSSALSIYDHGAFLPLSTAKYIYRLTGSSKCCNPFLFLWEWVVVHYSIVRYRSRYWAVCCDRCGRTDLFFGPEGAGGGMVKCECGHVFPLREAVARYSRQIAELKAYAEEGRRRENVRSVHVSFLRALNVFDQDWQFCHDSGTPRKITRLKDNITRMYQRMAICNANRVVNATKHASASNVAWCNTFNNDSLIGSLVTISAECDILSCRKESEILMQDSNAIAETIERYESVIDHYENLMDEFDGKTKEEARAIRMKGLYGCSHETDLPPLEEPINVGELMAHCNRVGKIKAILRQYNCVVFTVALVFALLVFAALRMM